MNQASAAETKNNPWANTPRLTANGLEIAYDEFGSTDDPAILLIMGLGTQMIAWSEPFCEALASKGFRVVRFDNRDVGLSEKIESPKVSIPRLLLRARLGLRLKVPYSLNDMADDAIGVLDALGIAKAHIVGASMGGMIAQIMAADHSHRCLSLTSIMSSSGHPKLPHAGWDVTKLLVKRPKDPSEDAAIAHGLKLWNVVGSPAYPPTQEELVERITASLRRSRYPKGYTNQLAAVLHNGDRSRLLRQIEVPSLIIHGTDDPLVPAECGIDTAEKIANSQIELIKGMGHDLPKQLIPRLTQLIGEHAKNAA